MNWPEHVNKVIHGDSLEVLKSIPDGVIQCCMTSPPYWGLRDYGIAGQIGLEPNLEMYVQHLVEVFHEIRRVLRDDGTLWLNLGDSYNNFRPGNYSDNRAHAFGGDRTKHKKPGLPDDPMSCKRGQRLKGLKEKDLCGIPWRVAFALQADGWYLRQDIIWHKPNPMPESVRDRCTKAHEYIFLLTKSKGYYYDMEAIKEPSVTNDPRKPYGSNGAWDMDGRDKRQEGAGNPQNRDATKRNKRSVWTITTKPYKGAHFATFPEDLVEPCILAGTSEKGNCGKCGKPWMRVMEKTKYTPKVVDVGVRNVDKSRGDKTRKLSEAEYNKQISTKTIGWQPTCTCNGTFINKIVDRWDFRTQKNLPEKITVYIPTIPLNEHLVVPPIVLDPFSGAGTVGVVTKKLKRDYVLIDLNAEYNELAEKRLDIK